MTAVAESTLASDLNRRIEPEIPRRRFVPGEGWTSRVPNVLRGLLLAVAAFSVVTALLPPLAHSLRGVRTVIETLLVPAPPNLAWAALLVIFGSALGKRKRSAWWFVVIILVLGIVESSLILFVVTGLQTRQMVTLASSLVLLVILLLSRRQFFAIVPRRNIAMALLTLVVGFAIAIPIGWLLVEALPGSVPRSDAIAYAANQVLGGLGSQEATGIEGRATRPVPFLLGGLGTLVYVAFGLALFRTRGKERMITGQDEVDLRVLLHDHADRDSLAYFATRRDKSVMWSPSRKAAVTYRVVNGVSLASADPIGDPESWPPAIEAWLEEARQFGWAPAAMGASEVGAEAYIRAGLEALSLGDEAIIEFSEYTLDGRHMRAVRQAVHRLERDGYTTRVRRHRDVPADQMAEVINDADRWRDTPNERGFSMALGRLGDPLDGECVLTEVFDSEGVRRALLSFSPWGRRGISLDLMRRDPAAENGVMETMVTATVNAGPLIGVERLSLNFAVMRAIFEEGARIGAGPVMRASRALLMFASRWWQLESLYRSNEKYEPDWVPRFLLFERSGDLPRVGIAAGLAEGFMERPHLPFAARGRESLADGAAASPVALWTPVATELAVADEGETAEQQRHLPEQELVRRHKLEQMRARGVDPYATDFDRADMIGDIRERFPDLAADTRTGVVVRIAGRVMLNRVTGKLVFAQVKDWSGQIQVMLSLGEVGQETLDRWKHEVDLGDHVGVVGEVITSKRGELSVFAHDFVITSKCLVPLPDKHAGLTDPEARTRQRYVDLIVNDTSREMVALRSTAIRALRESMWRRGFLEVDTPMLQTVHGGANARPFITHINAYDMRLYLRIAPELFLKRLLVGGVEKIFEVNRNFRNEGVDASHNPEFSSLEIYDAYGTYETMRVLTRDLILEIATAVYGRPIARRPLPDGGYEEIDLSPPWPTMTVHEGVSRALGEEVTVDTSEQVLRGHAARLEIPMDPAWDASACLLELYENLCEDQTTFPTFYLDFPTEVAPLTRKMPS
ncbi:MAG TPA: bifunctional lysylphosphatidylglycerol synthetase/lysine--tRNA ligase LysX, partial [Actinomycetota bacterium]|nr:bifunctional lysylphosphatidylglycerol synthetase/lysine--tRNA ligase LysX [Actinomycetota bacterium]